MKMMEEEEEDEETNEIDAYVSQLSYTFSGATSVNQGTH